MVSGTSSHEEGEGDGAKVVRGLGREGAGGEGGKDRIPGASGVVTGKIGE